MVKNDLDGSDMMLFALGLTWCSSVVIGQFRSLGNVMICFVN